MHLTQFGRHSGAKANYQRAKGLFYWARMKQEMVDSVAKCDICQRSKAERVSYLGLLQPLELPQQSWSNITMNFIKGLPKSNGKHVIMVVVDRFTKCTHFVAMAHSFNARKVAKLFMGNIYKLHGLPSSIVSDRDKLFTSAFWQELFKVMGTKLEISTAYHFQTDG